METRTIVAALFLALFLALKPTLFLATIGFPLALESVLNFRFPFELLEHTLSQRKLVGRIALIKTQRFSKTLVVELHGLCVNHNAKFKNKTVRKLNKIEN